MSDLIKPGPVEGIHLHNIGLGTMRSSGTYIGLFLQLEDLGMRVDILFDVMQTLGIPIEDLADRFQAITCKRCGMLTSPLYPCECKEPRP